MSWSVQKESRWSAHAPLGCTPIPAVLLDVSPNVADRVSAGDVIAKLVDPWGKGGSPFPRS